MDRGGEERRGEKERETSFPLSSALLPIRNWGLSSSEAKEGYNHLIHQLTCLGMASTHYMSNTVSGLWASWVLKITQSRHCSDIYFSNAALLLRVRTLCFTFQLEPVLSSIENPADVDLVRLMPNECITDTTVHWSRKDKKLAAGHMTHNRNPQHLVLYVYGWKSWSCVTSSFLLSLSKDT